MLLYDLIIEKLQENLPDNFIITYNNNLDTNWAEILPEAQESTIHGVLRVDSGSNDYVGNQTIKNENLRVTFAIPNIKGVFKEAIESIENLNDTINGSFLPLDNDKVCKLYLSGRSSANIETINRIEWVVTDLYLTTQVFNELVTSADYELTIDSNELDVAITNIVYDYTLQTEAKIVGVTNNPKNYPMAKQKQLIINCIPEKNATVYQNIINKEDTRHLFNISYNNGIITRTFKAHLVGVNESCTTGGNYVTTLKFLRTNENE